ncbi:MAG: 3'-5' exonuclease [Muribaculaceae bacterium]|nr:3'-5' exonuclease [Muribaculaceae bacterium]
MELNLKQPLIVFDVESTGLSITKDRIIELSYIKVYPDGQEEARTFRFNPGMPIPAETTALHHITDNDVANCPTFEQLATEIARIFHNCDIAGFNSTHFDIPLLAQEMAKANVEFDLSACRFIDVQTIFHKKEKRDLPAASRFYCGEEMENQHNAMADARTTLNVLRAQLDRYPDLENDVEALSRYSSHTRNVDLAGRVVLNEQGQPTINFGRYRGQLLDEVVARDPGYVGWVTSGDFAEDTKRVFTDARKRVKQAGKREASAQQLEALQSKFKNNM